MLRTIWQHGEPKSQARRQLTTMMAREKISHNIPCLRNFVFCVFGTNEPFLARQRRWYVKEVMRSALVSGSIGKGAHNRQHRRRQTVRVSIACKLHNTSSNKQRRHQKTRLTVQTKSSLSNKKHHNTR